MIQEYKRSFIDFMIESKVLTFGDFTTKSGRKTPFFINTGLYNTGPQMYKLGRFYADAIAYSCNYNTKKIVLFGPAYKGIPLVTTTAISLRELNPLICFNRKEAKDHGEGGSLIGYKPQDGDQIIIIEDVVTAGTSVRESITLLKSIANVEVKLLVVSVDRQEKGQHNKSALTEIYEEFGITTISIVNLDEILEYLWDKKVDDKLFLDDDMKKRIIEYRSIYGTTN
jgi:orotate phosphoribosyltransferase